MAQSSLSLLMMLLSLFSLFFAFTLENTQVLPQGVRSVMWKQGYIGSLTNRYGDNDTLYSLDGRLSRSFDAEEILKLHPRAPELISALNNALPSQYGLGDKIQLGDLRFEGDASVHYSAPVFAYGITEKWTMAIALPFTKLNADIRVVNGGNNNTKEIYNAIAAKGGLNPELDREFQRLMNIDLAQEFHNHLKQKSYKPLAASDSWRLADIQMISKFRYYNSPKLSLLNRILLNLPTGAEDDPNDLLDIPIFHRSFIELSQVQDYFVDKKNVFGSAISYVWNIPDQVDKRVPRYAGDYLPDIDRLETLDRDRGDAIKWELNWRTKWSDTLSTAFAYIGQEKTSDYYVGNRAYDYSLLQKDTESAFHKVEGQFSYSSVENFLNKKSAIPFVVSYRYSDIFAGRNTEKQRAHELTMVVFF